MLLSHHNGKLGASIWTFSLPAITTCPGSTDLCRRLCYATGGRFRFRGIRKAYARNYRDTKAEDFVDRVCGEIRNRGVLRLRIHTSGDFYSAEYAAKWREIVRRNRHVTFYAYTRSWRAPEILEELAKLAAEGNMHLWFSCDRQSGEPPAMPRVRRAWMAEHDADRPPYPVDLVFRNTLSGPFKRMDGVLVCPTDQKVERAVKITCDLCRLCFRHAAETAYVRKGELVVLY